MSCKYCSDKYDKYRTRKFGYERGDIFYTEGKYFNLVMEHDGEDSYIIISDIEKDDIFYVNYCPNCGDKLK